MPSDAQRYIDAVRQYADKVLAVGRDTYGPKATPMFVDGVDVRTLEPARWQYRELTWIPANLASHQNLIRTLVGLSALTGDGQYKQAAVDATRYAIDNLQTPSGLLFWGGHATYDALSDEWAGRHKLAKELRGYHEFMGQLPYYDLLWEVDPKFTERFIGALWNGHVVEWARLDIDRHAKIEKPYEPVDWNTPYVGGPVFYQSVGRSFIPISTDLIHAAGSLYQRTGNQQALEWAKRLAHRYMECRDPNTGLHGPLYTHKEEPDRAHTQFGDALPGHVVMEATFWSPHVSMEADLGWIMLGERLGPAGDDLVKWALEDLRAARAVGYDPQRKVFKGMLIDGVDTEKVLKTRGGYFGAKGTPIGRPLGVGASTFRVYALAARVSGDPLFWETAREMAQVRKLGDIGPAAGAEPAMAATESAEADELVGMLELHRMTGRQEFLGQACRIADNILAGRRVGELFVANPAFQYARLDNPATTALLKLAATLLGRADEAPDCWFSASFFACEWKDSEHYIYDFGMYSKPREKAP